MGKHITGLRHIGQVATTNKSRLVSIADNHTLHDIVRRMERCVRNVRAETTSQSCVEVVDRESLAGSLCIQSIAVTQTDFSLVHCSLVALIAMNGT